MAYTGPRTSLICSANSTKATFLPSFRRRRRSVVGAEGLKYKNKRLRSDKSLAESRRAPNRLTQGVVYLCNNIANTADDKRITEESVKKMTCRYDLLYLHASCYHGIIIIVTLYAPSTTVELKWNMHGTLKRFRFRVNDIREPMNNKKNNEILVPISVPLRGGFRARDGPQWWYIILDEGMGSNKQTGQLLLLYVCWLWKYNSSVCKCLKYYNTLFNKQ